VCVCVYSTRVRTCERMPSSGSAGIEENPARTRHSHARKNTKTTDCELAEEKKEIVVVVAREVPVLREDCCSLGRRGQAGPNPQPIAEVDRPSSSWYLFQRRCDTSPDSDIPMNVPIRML
jgi:hypothetical protein